MQVQHSNYYDYSCETVTILSIGCFRCLSEIHVCVDLIELVE